MDNAFVYYLPDFKGMNQFQVAFYSLLGSIFNAKRSNKEAKNRKASAIKQLKDFQVSNFKLDVLLKMHPAFSFPVTFNLANTFNVQTEV